MPCINPCIEHKGAVLKVKSNCAWMIELCLREAVKELLFLEIPFLVPQERMLKFASFLRISSHFLRLIWVT